MSTKSLLEIKKNDSVKVIYNHYDGYPECFGAKLCEFIENERDTDNLNKFFNSIVIVDSFTDTTEEMEHWATKYNTIDLSVSDQCIDDPYCLLRKAQGDFELYSKCLSNNDDIYLTGETTRDEYDRNWIDYTYTLDLDAKKLYVDHYNKRIFSIYLYCVDHNTWKLMKEE